MKTPPRALPLPRPPLAYPHPPPHTPFLSLGRSCQRSPWTAPVSGGGGGAGIWADPSPPPTHISKMCPQEKNKIHQRGPNLEGDFRYTNFWVASAPRVTFRWVVAPLRGPGQSPVLPFACCVGSLRSVGRCGRCSCWCRFRVRGAQWLVCRGCAECGGMCRLRVNGAQ